jgi:hypothetical protein
MMLMLLIKFGNPLITEYAWHSIFPESKATTVGYPVAIKILVAVAYPSAIHKGDSGLNSPTKKYPPDFLPFVSG